MKWHNAYDCGGCRENLVFDDGLVRGWIELHTAGVGAHLGDALIGIYVSRATYPQMIRWYILRGSEPPTQIIEAPDEEAT